mgnify:CR=1 FL=1
MGKKLVLLMVLVSVPTLFLVAACGGGSSQPPAAQASAQDVAAGKTLFEQNCNGCHPGGGQGAGPALKGRALASDLITERVRKGKGAMPAFAESKISNQQLAALVAYVQSLK